MPLSLQLLTRPVRVAGLVELAGAAALLSGALALGAHPLAPVVALAALVATGLVVGALAPLYGRGAAVGLWTARAGIALGAVALVLPEGRPTVALRVVAALVVLAGLRLVARGIRRAGDLPVWSCIAVGAGISAALVAPGLGGGIVLGLALLAVAAAIHVTFVAPATTAPSRAV
jgi:hypothetical protein